ncbi:cysteine desulfurase [Brucepastera parasyntrophica]|uniref:cysteine desulfurase family protein n=1 Tax=Brucepastera parasyntrophica TaxID=2880008 RepID=UPI00210B7AFD|nr:cysteine desulfurase family protein [Brucepastera parasyntrophica]ULQ59839.1 cysteine desulfurase [Brucepastera parasyntrophica]
MNIFLDWAATAPPDPEIFQETCDTALTCYGNPSSIHAAGQKSASKLAEARQKCAEALNVKPQTIVFTSGGTEAGHLPLLALLRRPVQGTLAISAIEHPAVIEQARILAHCGWKTLIIPATGEGFITPEAVLSTIRDDTAYVAVMAVNNETGAVQPVEEIAAGIADRTKGKKKPFFHVDIVQAAGKIPVNLNCPEIDSAAVSAHKLGGPRGIGLLYHKKRFEPFIMGGGQESGIRPGTENIAGAWGLAACLVKNCRSPADDRSYSMAEYIIESLCSVPGIAPVPETRKPDDRRFSPYIFQFTNSMFPGEVLVRILSERGIFISTGSACSSRSRARPVLQAMHVKPEKQLGAFRVSTGKSTTKQDIDCLTETLKDIYQKNKMHTKKE